MRRPANRSEALKVFSEVALIVVIAWVLIFLFRPSQRYKVTAPAAALDSQEYWRRLESITDSRIQMQNKVTVLPNGENFYKARPDGIPKAQQNDKNKAYIFKRGDVTQKLL